MLPALNLDRDLCDPCDAEFGFDDGDLEETDWQLPAVFRPSRPTIPTVPSVPNIDPLASDENTLATVLLERGRVSFALFGASTRVLQLVLDVVATPQIRSLGMFKSLIVDSWIVGSNALAVPARRADVEVAVVRAMIMLFSKRVLGFKQLGLARELIGALNFVAVAAASLRAIGREATSDLEQVLSEIAAVPFLIYTSMARLAVDSSKTMKTWAMTVNWDEIRDEAAASATIDHNIKGKIGRYGRTLVTEWRAFLKANVELAAYVKRHLVYGVLMREKSILEFDRVLA